MKNLLFLALLLLPLFLSAQRFEGGLLAGLNASQIDGDFTGTYNKAGLVGGAFVATKFQNDWGGQLEIRYAAKGSTVKLDSLTDRKIRLQYIELPILATYDPYKFVQFHGGISLGYLFSAAQNDGNLGYIEFQQFDPYEVAACVGASYKYTNRLYFSARFSYSLMPIYARYSGATGQYAMYNNVLTFAAYYWIGRNWY